MLFRSFNQMSSILTRFFPLLFIVLPLLLIFYNPISTTFVNVYETRIEKRLSSDDKRYVDEEKWIMNDIDDNTHRYIFGLGLGGPSFYINKSTSINRNVVKSANTGLIRVISELGFVGLVFLLIILYNNSLLAINKNISKTIGHYSFLAITSMVVFMVYSVPTITHILFISIICAEYYKKYEKERKNTLRHQCDGPSKSTGQ